MRSYRTVQRFFEEKQQWAELRWLLIKSHISEKCLGTWGLIGDEVVVTKSVRLGHATSRNSGTPVAVIRSPTQRIGDAPAALCPPQTEHKAAQSLLPHWLDGYSECNSCSSRVLLAHVESANCPVAYQGLKITTSLSYVSLIFSVR
ncbi:hypothetical protein [Bathymodiolus japonicus methanotrophic gill symbiont]|uniref:hypothetical protein n=1 Tax=Bathymodiolus japonicus methanotrophic gill symbiont TaxID=113269 RepID=UPI001C8D6E5B|nr:hypothetical protein [Bathymodiolus japonicus methanotrophic gill symbiont]